MQRVVNMKRLLLSVLAASLLLAGQAQADQAERTERLGGVLVHEAYSANCAQLRSVEFPDAR